MLKKLLMSVLRPNGKLDFICQLDDRAQILDVGCGNNSPFKTKSLLPDCHYTGIDVDNYNQSRPMVADEYILATSDEFSAAVAQFASSFDAVISSHNLEHCEDRESVLLAMLGAVKKSGKIYISFPCEESTLFPSRRGTLNYFDDVTHKQRPPSGDAIVKVCESNGFEVIYRAKRYQPTVLRVLGFLVEPMSKLSNRVLRGTWEYWGFESIVVAKRVK